MKHQALYSCINSVLGHSGCYLKKATGWVAYKEQKLITHSSGGWKSEVKVPAWWCEGPFLGRTQAADLWPCPHIVEGARELLEASFTRQLSPS